MASTALLFLLKGFKGAQEYKSFIASVIFSWNMEFAIWSNSGIKERWKKIKEGQKHQQSTSRNSIWNIVGVIRSFGTLASLVDSELN